MKLSQERSLGGDLFSHVPAVQAGGLEFGSSEAVLKAEGGRGRALFETQHWGDKYRQVP